MPWFQRTKCILTTAWFFIKWGIKEWTKNSNSIIAFCLFWFLIGWIHLSWIRQVFHGYWNLLPMNSNLYTRTVFNYMWIVYIHFVLSMYNATSHSNCPWIVNCSMDSVNEHFIYSWIVNYPHAIRWISIIHPIQQDPKTI